MSHLFCNLLELIVGHDRPGTLPEGQNSPQKCKYDLYAEQVCLFVCSYSKHSRTFTQMTGTSFVAPRHENQNACVCLNTPYLT